MNGNTVKNIVGKKKFRVLFFFTGYTLLWQKRESFLSVSGQKCRLRWRQLSGTSHQQKAPSVFTGAAGSHFLPSWQRCHRSLSVSSLPSWAVGVLSYLLKRLIPWLATLWSSSLTLVHIWVRGSFPPKIPVEFNKESKSPIWYRNVVLQGNNDARDTDCEQLLQHLSFSTVHTVCGFESGMNFLCPQREYGILPKSCKEASSVETVSKEGPEVDGKTRAEPMNRKGGGSESVQVRICRGLCVTISSGTARGQRRLQHGVHQPPPPQKCGHSWAYAENHQQSQAFVFKNYRGHALWTKEND